MVLYITGDSVACMINNLGGTSVLELNIIAKEAIELLGMQDITMLNLWCNLYTLRV